MSIIQYYFTEYLKLKKQYGKKTVPLIEIGGFFEIYSDGTDNSPNLKQISSLLDLVISKKNKKFPQVDQKNPYFSGFPVQSVNKYISKLVDANYTVVIISQYKDPETRKVSRKITAVYTSGTYIDKQFNYESNNILSIYLETTKNIHRSSINICCGLVVLDLSTGKLTVHETFQQDIENSVFDEIFRFIGIYQPKEIIISYQDQYQKINKHSMVQYLELQNKNYKFIKKINPEITKPKYQNVFLGKIYQHHILSPLESLDLNTKIYATISMIVLLEFVYEHDKSILNNINAPETYQENKRLMLYNNAIYQLNILDNNTLEFNTRRFRSLFDVVNKTSTPMGRRFLKETLLNPLINIKQIQRRYDGIKNLLKHKLYQSIDEHLVEIYDIERLHRRLGLKILHPSEFASIASSYDSIKQIIITLKENPNFAKLLPNEKIIKSFNAFRKDYREKFDLTEMSKYILTEITGSFFKIGVSDKIDRLNGEIKQCLKFMTSCQQVLSELINGENKRGNKPVVYVLDNETEGYFLKTTVARANILKEQFKKKKTINIGKIKINTSKIEYKKLKSGVKIYFSEFENNSNALIKSRRILQTQCQKKYLEILEEYHQQYHQMFYKIVEFVAICDFLVSGAKVAVKYNYCCPEIDEDSGVSYLEGKQVRHPIVERITEDVYVPIDITLGKENSGILLYGINSCGKTTCMRTIGVCIVLAQSGLFVPATKFKYCPFNNIFARITGNDNLLKGYSSFVLEMSELRSIIAHVNIEDYGKHSIILGDEICRSTEQISAVSIVATTISMLSKANFRFIFATHLHILPELDEIKELQNIKCYYLSVEHDQKTDTLIFNRQLKEGVGEQIYGLKVAKYIINNNQEFNLMATKIKDKLLSLPEKIISPKKSRYNKNVIMDHCHICQSRNNLHTHHINEQHNCRNGFSIDNPHIAKNSTVNLVVLCEKCHNDLHLGKYQVTYISTSEGKQLKIEKKKFNNYQLKFIKNICSLNSNSTTQIELIKKYGGIIITKEELHEIKKEKLITQN